MIELLEETDKVINEDLYKRAGNKDGSWQSVSKSVSAYDLHKALNLGKDDQIKDDVLLLYLWELGIDVENFAVVEQVIWHRPLSAPTNSPIYATRWIGQERTDKEWIDSGFASKEARLATANFSDLATEIEKLGRQSNFTAEIVQHMKDKKNISGKKDGKVSGLGGHA